MPVMNADRLGAQTGDVEKTRMYRTPSAAKPSRFGVLTFFAQEQTSRVLGKLANAGLQLRWEPPSAEAESPLTGKRIVFTGALQSLTRTQAKGMAEDLGARVSSSVSKSTDYVIAGDSPGSKAEKAEQLGVAILTEDEFIALADRDAS